MLGTEHKVRLDEVREAMERVRSGESDFEQIGLPSGQMVTIRRDDNTPIGIRIQTPAGPGTLRRPPGDGFRRRRMLRRARVAAGRVQSGGFQPQGLGLGGTAAVRETQDAYVHQGLAFDHGQARLVFRVHSFPPAPERPSTYPEDLPFLQNLSVSISVGCSEDGSKRARNAAWMKPTDPRWALQEIRSQLRAGGWEEGETSHASTFMGHTWTWSFERGEVQRALVHMDFGNVSQIMLFERVEE